VPESPAFHPDLPALVQALGDARQRTLALVGDLSDEQLEVPLLSHVNPVLWELGHVAFFFDVFVLGELDGSPPLIEQAYERFESFGVDHDSRWELEFPGRSGILNYMARVEERVLQRLQRQPLGEREHYLHRLALLHEDMHGEAFTYMRQALGYGAPRPKRVQQAMGHAAAPAAGPWPGDVQVPAGRYRLGSERGRRFSFDNEHGQQSIDLAPFQIARAPVTQAEYLGFVKAGAYAQPRLWSAAGRAWLAAGSITQPAYWRAVGAGWERVHFGVAQPLAPHEPMQHVSYFEAEAYCRWAGRRLPSEAEWELAAAGVGTQPKLDYPWGAQPPGPLHAQLDGERIGCVDVAAHPAGDSEWGCRQMLGNVWEWTASDFYPFPGFQIHHPYREYSAPWFGDHKVLRGGAWATRSRLIRLGYRNFFRPGRRDILSGFRTCAL